MSKLTEEKNRKKNQGIRPELRGFIRTYYYTQGNFCLEYGVNYATLNSFLRGDIMPRFEKKMREIVRRESQ